MRLADILTANRIATGIEPTDKGNALRTLAQLLAVGHARLDQDRVFNVLCDRERLVSTGVGAGVAIPHGRIDDLDTLEAAVAICPKGVAFDSVDGKPVQIFVAVLAPNGNPAVQLKTLAGVARVLKDDGVRTRLLQAQDGQQVLDIIAEAEQRH